MKKKKKRSIPLAIFYPYLSIYKQTHLNLLTCFQHFQPFQLSSTLSRFCSKMQLFDACLPVIHTKTSPKTLM